MVDWKLFLFFIASYITSMLVACIVTIYLTKRKIRAIHKFYKEATPEQIAEAIAQLRRDYPKGME